MKRLIPIFLCLLLLCGCADRNLHEIKTETGEVLLVNTEEDTITHGDTVYTYQWDTSVFTETVIRINYPDGVVFTWSQKHSVVIQSNTGNPPGGYVPEPDEGTYTGEFDESRYLPGLVLAKAVYNSEAQTGRNEREMANNFKFIVTGGILLVFGLVLFFFPEEMWHVKHWWCVDGGAPSQLYLDGSRGWGIISLIVGIILLLVGIF